jgi:hypothetical protein
MTGGRLAFAQVRSGAVINIRGTEVDYGVLQVFGLAGSTTNFMRVVGINVMLCSAPQIRLDA